MDRRKFVVWDRLPAILETEDVCEILGIHYNTLSRYRKDGTLPMTKAGRRYVIDRDQLRAFIERS